MTTADGDQASALSVLVVEGHSLISDALVLSLRSFGVREALAVNPATLDARTVVQLALTCSIVLVGLLADDGRTTIPLVQALAASGSRVLVITTDEGTALTGDALRAGAEAVVHKDMPLGRLVDTLHALHEGRQLLTDDERQALIDALPSPTEEQMLLQRFEALTEREADTLRRLVEGQSPKAMALDEDISIHTVRKHIQGVLTKLGVQSQREALALARHAGWPPEAHAALGDHRPDPPLGAPSHLV